MGPGIVIALCTIVVACTVVMFARLWRRGGKVSNGLLTRRQPKRALFPGMDAQPVREIHLLKEQTE
jgi:hypothetical protein